MEASTRVLVEHNNVFKGNGWALKSSGQLRRGECGTQQLLWKQF